MICINFLLTENGLPAESGLTIKFFCGIGTSITLSITPYSWKFNLKFWWRKTKVVLNIPKSEYCVLYLLQTTTLKFRENNNEYRNISQEKLVAKS